MKIRRREVNIFNMSLLDILCGALGAFCFMMLALFPAYIEAQKRKSSPDAEERARRAEARAARAEQEAQQNLADQTLVAFRLHWTTTDDVDMWIEGPTGWWGPKPNRLPAGGKLLSPVPDSTDGTKRAESLWLWNAPQRGAVYRLFGEVVSRSPGSSGPVPVRAYAVYRFFADKGERVLGLPEVSYSQLATDGQRIELAVLSFDETGKVKDFKWTNRSEPGGS